MTAHWGHAPVYSYKGGRCRVACKCGRLNTVWFDSYIEARTAYVRHVGLREERRRDRHEG